MSIKVVVADDSEIMRQALQRLLKSEPAITVVGEASSFAAAVQLVADYKPDVLLIDLHLPHKRDFAPAVVKSQLHCVDCTIAISFAVDQEAAGLAESYGAVALLDKMKLYNELIPAILKHHRAIPVPPLQKPNPADPSQPNQIS
jgi:two-component system response regulator NreC